MTPNIEGRLKIDLHCDDGLVKRVDIHSSRPFQAMRLFERKTVDDVLILLPRLFSVCGIAQAASANAAIVQASGVKTRVRTVAAHQILTCLETAREHLWRVLIDWPAAMEREPDTGTINELQTLTGNVRSTLFGDNDPFSLNAEANGPQQTLHDALERLDSLIGETVFACNPSRWSGQTRSLNGFLEWIERNSTNSTAFLGRVIEHGWSDFGACLMDPLPELDQRELNRCLGVPDPAEFIEQADLGRPGQGDHHDDKAD